MTPAERHRRPARRTDIIRTAANAQAWPGRPRNWTIEAAGQVPLEFLLHHLGFC